MKLIARIIIKKHERKGNERSYGEASTVFDARKAVKFYVDVLGGSQDGAAWEDQNSRIGHVTVQFEGHCVVHMSDAYRKASVTGQLTRGEEGAKAVGRNSSKNFLMVHNVAPCTDRCCGADASSNADQRRAQDFPPFYAHLRSRRAYSADLFQCKAHLGRADGVFSYEISQYRADVVDDTNCFIPYDHSDQLCEETTRFKDGK